MGQTITKLAAELGIDVASSMDIGDDLAGGLKQGDVIVDFSFHESTSEVIDHAIALGKPLVIGTTGHSIATRAALLKKAEQVPCVWAGNYSVGVNLLNALTQQAAKVLSTDYDAEVIEMHHRFKRMLRVAPQLAYSKSYSNRASSGKKRCGTDAKAFPVNALIAKSAFIPFVVAM